jgi:hypothetical protein
MLKVQQSQRPPCRAPAHANRPCVIVLAGDGTLDAHEILLGIQALAREKKRSRQLSWVVMGLLGFLLVLLAAQTGLMFKVIIDVLVRMPVQPIKLLCTHLCIASEDMYSLACTRDLRVHTRVESICL